MGIIGWLQQNFQCNVMVFTTALFIAVILFSHDAGIVYCITSVEIRNIMQQVYNDSYVLLHEFEVYDSSLGECHKFQTSVLMAIILELHILFFLRLSLKKYII